MTTLPALAGNPLLAAYRCWLASRDDLARTDAVARYAFAVPTDDALDAVARHAPGGIVELGAGTGYWARLLSDRGVDVIAYDIAPPPASDNHFFAGATPWFDIEPGDQRAVARHPTRTLLLVWPTSDAWAGDALQAFAAAGGTRVAYVGEGAGGRMGDDVLHAALGLLHGCLACTYAIVDSPCICAIQHQWRRVATIELPHWGGYDDDLYLFDRDEA